jgi:23S rRNA (cytidine1920-2'-O)/16S rRNA (cytidine1409-2'-O)-methyltransferase
VGARRRLDAELVRRELTASRTEAQTLIAANRVLVNGAPSPTSPPVRWHPASRRGRGPPARFVGRGGEKLDHALDVFRSTSPVGAHSTSARRPAASPTASCSEAHAHVVALDVGHGQLHERLGADDVSPTSSAPTCATIDADGIGGPVDLVVGDLSFISLRLVVPRLTTSVQAWGADGAARETAVRSRAPRCRRGRGVITDPDVSRTRPHGEVDAALVEARAAVLVGWTESPITGADGNREFLVHARPRRWRTTGDRIVPSSRTTNAATAGVLPRNTSLHGCIDHAVTLLDARARGRRRTRSRPPGVERPPSDADLVLSLGGDGTMLRAVHLLDGAPVPLLGVNLGWLGYLTEVEADRLEDALERFEQAGPPSVAGTSTAPDARRHRRRRRRSGARWWRALNEAVIEKRGVGSHGAPPRAHRRRAVHVVRRRRADRGHPHRLDRVLVVGPRPGRVAAHRALLLTPVAPHMLFDRSLVLDPTEHIEVEVMGHRSAELAVDGPAGGVARRRRRGVVSPVAGHGPVRAVRRVALPPDPEGQVRPRRPVGRHGGGDRCWSSCTSRTSA